MTMFRRAMLIVGVGLLLPASSAFGQDVARTALDAGEVQSMVVGEADRARSDRALLQQFLDRSDVRSIAEGARLDVEDVRAAASVLNDADARRVAEQVRSLDALLAGGDTITISTTMIIIALLVLIIILLA